MASNEEILRFGGTNTAAVRKLNILADALRALQNINGGDYINVNRTGGGTTITLAIDRLLERIPKLASLKIKIFEVQAVATTNKDGWYNCYEQTLDATHLTSTAGDDKFVNAEDTPIEVLNLRESHPEATYSPALVIYDLITAWEITDDESGVHWAGIPLVTDSRRAVLSENAPAGTVIQANLVDRHGDETEAAELGFDVAVNCNIVNGTDLDEAAPLLTNNAEITVRNQQGVWYCTTVFNGTIICECV